MKESVGNLAAEWLAPTIKPLMEERLRNSSKGSRIETTESAISQEYYRSWLDAPISNPLQRLVRHPLLTKEDKQEIDRYVSSQQQAQLSYASIFLALSLGIYGVFLRKTTIFQNIFNNKQRSRVNNLSRKLFATYAVFLGWMVMLNSHYEKKVPDGLHEQGYFKKYNIVFTEKYA